VDGFCCSVSERHGLRAEFMEMRADAVGYGAQKQGFLFTKGQREMIIIEREEGGNGKQWAHLHI
jgi:hypothetical protein